MSSERQHRAEAAASSLSHTRTETRSCHGGQITTISHCSPRPSLFSCSSSDLRTDLLLMHRRHSSLGSGPLKPQHAPVGAFSSSASGPTLPSAGVRSKLISEVCTSQSLQTDSHNVAAAAAARPGPVARQPLTAVASSVHVVRRQDPGTADCTLDSVSIPLAPATHDVGRGAQHRAQRAAEGMPAQDHSDSDPFLDEDTLTATLSDCDTPLYAQDHLSHTYTAGPHDWAVEAPHGAHDTFGRYRSALAMDAAWDAVPWADDPPPSEPGMPCERSPRCSCDACCDGGAHAPPVFACASVRSTRSVSSSPSRPRRAFLGGCEIHGTMTRALAELDAASSGSLGILNTGRSHALACRDGGGGLLSPRFQGAPCDAQRHREGTLRSGAHSAHSAHAATAPVGGCAAQHGCACATGAGGESALECERVRGEAYLGMCRLPEMAERAAAARVWREIFPA
eukprot:jgi/Ulvmu1/8747/UM048_0001.1